MEGGNESEARGMIKEGAEPGVTHPRTHKFTGSAGKEGLRWSHMLTQDQSEACFALGFVHLEN